MTKPLISIVLPTYNGERYLQKQLDSLYSQSYQNFEIILTDDASSDATQKIIHENLGRENVTAIFNRQNLGFIQNFSNAIQTARGEYIAPCDQDDVWLPDKLQTLVEQADDCLMVYSNSKLVDENEKPLGRSLSESLKVNMISGDSFRAFYYGNCVAAHTMMFHRSLLTHLKRFPDTVYHDHWIAFIASRLGRIKAVNEKLVLYRRHDESVTRTVKNKKLKKNLLSYLAAKAERQRLRNSSKLVKLKTFQAFNQSVNMPDAELDAIIAELERFDDYFFNRRLYSILSCRQDEYFAISQKSRRGLMLEECFGMRFYKYFPITL